MSKRRQRFVYQIPRLTRQEYATLMWLADHGYDGGVLKAAGVEKEHADGGVTLGGMSEPEAWTVREYIDDDPDAWLASNGSRSLAEKLNKFVESIV